MRRYCPILRTKAGEVAALSHLPSSSLARLLPVVRLNATPAKTFVASMASAWSGRVAALGGGYNFNLTGSASTYRTMFRALGDSGVNVIPSVDPNASGGYLSAVGALIGRYAPGVVVRTDLNNLPTIGGWVSSNGWSSKDCDLLIWLSHIAAIDPPSLQAAVTSAINKHVPSFSAWRSVTLAASSAPKDFGTLPFGRSLVPRREWQLWASLAPAFSRLDYGDTGHVHPSLDDPPGVAMARATVSVRYTIDDHWIIIKGSPTTGKTGKSMGTQYLSHAKALVKEAEFDMLPACWADDEIKKIAAGTRTPGSRQTWVGLSFNRHISHVVDRLP